MALLTLAAALSACSSVDVASRQSLHGFRAFAWNPAIKFEPGAELLAQTLAQQYPQAVAAVEQAHQYRFARPPAVFVCANDQSFARFVVTPSPISHVTAATFFNKTFISPKLARQPQRTYAVLAHELSHLHLMQWLGPGHYAEQLPVWFQEGLAVDVAGGGGAEMVGESQAAAAILRGQHFDPRPYSSGRRGYADGLEPHMFYRQSAMFLGFLRRDQAAFHRLMRGLIQGADFSRAITRAYGADLLSLWRAFVWSLSRRT